MENLAALKQAVLNYVKRTALQGELHGVTAVCEFPAAMRQSPLKAAAVAVGILGVELQEGGLGGYYGDSADGSASVYGSTAVVVVYFDIYCPRQQGGEGCHRIYETLCDALLLQGNAFGFFRMKGGAIGVDQESGANHMRAEASLRAAVTHQDQGLAVREFKVRSEKYHGNE